MNIGIIGSGNIGSIHGKLWHQAGHQVMYGSRNPGQLKDKNLVEGVKFGTIAEAAAFGEVIMLAIPWNALPIVISQIQDVVTDKIVIDATNQYARNLEGQVGLVSLPKGETATSYNRQRIPSRALIKAYNTLTAGFQAQSAGRSGAGRVVMPYAGEGAQGKPIVAQLIHDSGFVPFDVGDAQMARFIEPPRGERSLYGEEWNLGTIEKRLAELKSAYG